jgi:hypothetical protein
MEGLPLDRSTKADALTKDTIEGTKEGTYQNAVSPFAFFFSPWE